MVQQFSPARIDRDDVWALIPRIQAHHEPAFDGGGGAGSGRHPPGRPVHRRLVEEETVQTARTMSAPMDAAGVRAKFRALTDGVVVDERQQAIVDMVARLESVGDIVELIALLAPEARSAFETDAPS